MRRFGWSVAAAALATLAAAGVAAVPPTVEDVVARYVQARGGLKKIRAIETLRQSGRVTSGANRTGLAVRELKRPNRSRFEVTVQGVTAVFASDGTRGWQVSPFDGEMGPTPLAEEAVSEAVEQGDIEGPLVDWQAKGHRVELVGREAVGGKDAYKLKVSLKSGAIRHEYIDVKSSRLVRTDSVRQVRGRPVQMQTTYGEFKKTQGVLFPRRIEVQAVGRPQRTTIHVDTVEVNPPLSDARFQMPAGAK
jgi:outer membrane lipoprotein-sorting protein